jgi:excinuclease ABC subunit C
VAGATLLGLPEIRKLRLKIPVIFIAKSKEEIHVPESHSPLPVKRTKRHRSFIQE